MTRGNQRDLARQRRAKKEAGQPLRGAGKAAKTANTKSGSEMARDKEALATLMREKQAAAEARKAAEKAAGGANTAANDKKK